MKKKVAALLLTFALAAALAGCGGGSGASKGPEPAAEEAEDKGGEISENTDEPSAENQDKSLGTGYNELAPLMTYEEFAAAKAGSPVTIESYVQVKNAFDDQQSAVTLYAQDEEGAYLVCDLPITQEQYDNLETGQKIRVSGDKNEEAGEVRIVNATGMVEDGSYAPEVTDASDLLGKDDLASYKNHVVSFKGLKSVDTEDPGGDLLRFFYGPDGNGDPGDDLYFSAEKDGTVYLFKVESDLCGEGTDVYDKVTYVEEDAVIDLEGVIYDTEEGLPLITDMVILE
ncbi:MAG: hypothetical protein E7239_10685 [Sarcina sp.]|nr:hypothetical protein [Sarcina sp.]